MQGLVSCDIEQESLKCYTRSQTMACYLCDQYCLTLHQSNYVGILQPLLTGSIDPLQAISHAWLQYNTLDLRPACHQHEKHDHQGLP